MNITRIIGACMLIVGIALAITGFTATDSLANTLSNTFLGHFTKTTTWYIIGGIALAIGGLLILLGKFGSKKS